MERESQLTIAAVDQIGPNDHLLGEAEDSEPASFEGRVEHVAGVGHHVLAFEDAESDQVDLGPVQQQPPVRHCLLPANVARILPQKLHLQNNNIISNQSQFPSRLPTFTGSHRFRSFHLRPRYYIIIAHDSN